MNTGSYDQAFHRATADWNQASADAIVGWLSQYLVPQSVLDVGCGQGVWLSAWARRGVADLRGVDGEGVPLASLRVQPDQYTVADLALPLDLGRRFDLVMSLEVAEHLPRSRAASFVRTLTRHGDLVLFSAAPPGQGGLHHVNEQPFEFWRALFAGCGYEVLDAVRPAVRTQPGVQPWYRFNTFLFGRSEHIAELPDALGRCRVPPDVPLRDVSPLWYRLRKAAIRRVPGGLQDALARLKLTVGHGS